MNFPNLLSFAFVDPSMFFATMTLKYGKHFADDGQPRTLTELTFADCRNIVLRGPADGNWSADGGQIDHPMLQDWPSARQLLANVGQQITTHLAAENLQLGQVIVQSLKPGGCIGWHIDNSPYAKQHHRFKLLVSPCAGGNWYSGGETLAPGIGNLTYVNHHLLNSAINLGAVPQVSLVVDVRRPQLQ
jgi:hypothetical protein